MMGNYFSLAGLFVASILVASVADGNAGDLTHGWRDFYSSTDYGQMGVVQSRDLNVPLISPVQPDVPLTVNSRGKTILAFNHVDQTATSEDMVPTYFSALIFLAHKGPPDGQKPVLELFRNSGWMRDFCWRSDCFDPNGVKLVYSAPAELNNCSQHDLLACVDERRKQDREIQLDDLLGAPFDGQVLNSPDLDSWAKRATWIRALQQEHECSTGPSYCEVWNFLISFTPSAGHANTRPPLIEFNSWSTTSASVYVYSPNESDFRNHYSIVYR